MNLSSIMSSLDNNDDSDSVSVLKNLQDGTDDAGVIVKKSPSLLDNQEHELIKISQGNSHEKQEDTPQYVENLAETENKSDNLTKDSVENQRDSESVDQAIERSNLNEEKDSKTTSYAIPQPQYVKEYEQTEVSILMSTQETKGSIKKTFEFQTFDDEKALKSNENDQETIVEQSEQTKSSKKGCQTEQEDLKPEKNEGDVQFNTKLDDERIETKDKEIKGMVMEDSLICDRESHMKAEPENGNNLAINEDFIEIPLDKNKPGYIARESDLISSDSFTFHRSFNRNMEDSEVLSEKKANEVQDFECLASCSQTGVGQSGKKSMDILFNLDLEIKRSTKIDFKLMSPIHQRLQLDEFHREGYYEGDVSGVILEEFDYHIPEKKNEAAASFIKQENLHSLADLENKPIQQDENIAEEKLAVASRSREASPVNDNKNEAIEETKNLSFMERKLKKIYEENLKSMGAFEFKKKCSKLEKEKQDCQSHKNDENVSINFSKTKTCHVDTPFMSDVKKHYSRIQLEKLKNKNEGDQEEKVLSAKVTPIRPPLQMIQSEAEREIQLRQELKNSLQKDLSFTPQTGQKKRKYDNISMGEELNCSLDQNSNLKRLKKSDENNMESLEETLAKSVKKMPRIQLEQLKSKEKERMEKEHELKELCINFKDVVFKVENPLSFEKDYESNSNSHCSGLEKKSEGKASLSRSSSTVNYLNCVVCAGSIGMGEHSKELYCSHKTHMDCFNKMINKKDCPLCNNDRISKSSLQR